MREDRVEKAKRFFKLVMAKKARLQQEEAQKPKEVPTVFEELLYFNDSMA